MEYAQSAAAGAGGGLADRGAIGLKNTLGNASVKEGAQILKAAARDKAQTVKRITGEIKNSMIETGQKVLNNIKTAFKKSPLGNEIGAVGKSIKATDTANPSDIKLSQPTVSPNFSKGGHTISSTVDDLKSGRITPDDIDAIRVFEYAGKLWTLDNRRLVAFELAGIKKIPINKVSLKDPKIKKEFDQKFNPIDGKGDMAVVTPSTNRFSVEMLLKKYGKIK